MYRSDDTILDRIPTENPPHDLNICDEFVLGMTIIMGSQFLSLSVCGYLIVQLSSYDRVWSIGFGSKFTNIFSFFVSCICVCVSFVFPFTVACQIGDREVEGFVNVVAKVSLDDDINGIALSVLLSFLAESRYRIVTYNWQLHHRYVRLNPQIRYMTIQTSNNYWYFLALKDTLESTILCGLTRDQSLPRVRDNSA